MQIKYRMGEQFVYVKEVKELCIMGKNVFIKAEKGGFSIPISDIDKLIIK